MRQPPADRPPPGGVSGKPKKPGRTAPAANPRLAAQTRKLLGKHWANKYRHGRG